MKKINLDEYTHQDGTNLQNDLLLFLAACQDVKVSAIVVLVSESIGDGEDFVLAGHVEPKNYKELFHRLWVAAGKDSKKLRHFAIQGDRQ